MEASHNLTEEVGGKAGELWDWIQAVMQDGRS